MNSLGNDALLALRSWLRQPELMLAAVVCIALGVGATTTVYSAIRALVLHPVPAANGQRVVRVSELPPNPSADANGVAPATFLEWQRELRSYDHLAGFDWTAVSITSIEQPERVSAVRVTPGFFAILARAPIHGRALTQSDVEPGRDRVVVLSEPLWKRRFAGDPSAVGKSIMIDGTAHEIVGVMPREFVFPPGSELWLPLSITPAQASDRMASYIGVIATLKPGVTVQQANAEVDSHQQTVAARFPQARAGWTAIAEPAQKYYGANPRSYMSVAFVAVLLVLLIACANVANLLLARATGRVRELAVRAALGASRGRIARMLLTESLILALIGGLSGVLVALWGVLLFRNSIPNELLKFLPGWTAIRVDGPTLGFALLMALGSSLLFGILPALRGSRDSIVTMYEGARGSLGSRVRNRTRSALVVFEIALALSLVVSTGLMLRSFRNLLDAHPGFRRDQVLTMRLELPLGKYDSPERRSNFYLQLEERLRGLAGVQRVGFVNVLPMDWNDRATRLSDEARRNALEAELPITRWRVVSDEYFRTMEIPLLHGRSFDERDTFGSPPVVIVSERLVQQLWPTGTALGQRVRLIGDTTWRAVVGVVADTRHNPNMAGDALQPTVHVPLRQQGPGSMAVVLRTTGQPAALSGSAQREISRIDPALAAGEVRPLERVIHIALAPQRTTAGMLGVFGVVALLLACVGAYGVMSYAVARRANELGVRVALGARQEDVLRLILKHGARLTGAGALLGLGAAWILARAMQGLMKDTAPPDPITFALGALLLITTALLACYIPARRAASADPTALLRRE